VQNPDDLRVQRTRKLIQQALFDLTLEKGFASITVRDIADRAQVNRSTFYRHFLDKYDLLNQYMDELQAHVAEVAAASMKGSPEKVPSGLLVLIQHVQANAAFYRVMLGPNGDQAFIHRFRRLAEDRYRHLFTHYGESVDPGAPPTGMRLSYIAYAGVGALLWWLENNQPTSADQLAIWLGQLNMTSAGLLAPLDKPTARL